MRYLEVRRHSKREPLEQHLSQWGVSFARDVGQELGPFDEVVTSPLPRCIETAVAMGFAVSRVIPGLAGDDGSGEKFPGINEIDWELGYAGFAQVVRAQASLARFVEEQASIWQDVVSTLPEGGQALLIAHGGGFLEGAAVHCLPFADHFTWGAASKYCEGLWLGFEKNGFTQATIVRVDQ